MTITLPDELTEPLSWIGFTWPEADEDKLAEAGQAWINYGTQMRTHAEHANTAARQVWTDNYGDSIQAFERWWNDDGPGENLNNAVIAAELIGAALLAFAAVTIALKVAFIAQLVLLAVEVAQAIATAVPTAGASMLEVPVFIAISRTAIRKLIQKAISAVQREVGALLRKAAALLKRAGARNLSEKVLAQSKSTAFKGLMREVELADVRSPVNGANFYSGRDPAGNPMRGYAEANVDGVNAVTLEQTPGGKYFDDKLLYETGSPIDINHADQVWSRLSQRYAQTAEGDVTAWSHNPRPGSIWNTVERPALATNPKVTSINVVDPVP